MIFIYPLLCLSVWFVVVFSFRQGLFGSAKRVLERFCTIVHWKVVGGADCACNKSFKPSFSSALILSIANILLFFVCSAFPGGMVYRAIRKQSLIAVRFYISLFVVEVVIILYFQGDFLIERERSLPVYHVLQVLQDRLRS